MKTINVHVIPNARKPSIKMENNVFKVKVAAPAVDGKANKALLESLAEYLQVRKSSLSIVRGETTRKKIVVCRERAEQDT